MSKVLILTINATEHFFILCKKKPVIGMQKMNFQYRNEENEQKYLYVGVLN